MCVLLAQIADRRPPLLAWVTRGRRTANHSPSRASERRASTISWSASLHWRWCCSCSSEQDCKGASACQDSTWTRTFALSVADATKSLWIGARATPKKSRRAASTAATRCRSQTTAGRDGPRLNHLGHRAPPLRSPVTHDCAHGVNGAVVDERNREIVDGTSIQLDRGHAAAPMIRVQHRDLVATSL